MVYFDKLTNISRTQVLATGIEIDDLIKTEVLEEIKSKLSDSYHEFAVADLRIMLLPKLEKPQIKENEEGIVLELGSADFLRFEHPTRRHRKDKVVVITSNRISNIDKLLK